MTTNRDNATPVEAGVLRPGSRLHRLTARAAGMFIPACYGVGLLLFALAFAKMLPVWRAPAQEAPFGFARSPARHTMLVMFRPGDCSSHEGLIAALNQVHASGEIRVRGVMVDVPDEAAREDALVDFAPEFPLMAGAEKRTRGTLRRLGYRATPTVAVIDEDGRPVMVIPPHLLPWKQVDAVGVAARLVAAQRVPQART